MNDIKEYTLLKAYVDVYRKLDKKVEKYLTDQCLECIETVLNLVEEQQKENEMLKAIIYQNHENTIEKDKIKSKIKEIDGQGTFDAKIVLEHLLEEN